MFTKRMKEQYPCLEEYEKYIKIGKALELAFEKLPYLGLVYGNPNDEDGCFSLISELIEWYEKQEK